MDPFVCTQVCVTSSSTPLPLPEICSSDTTLVPVCVSSGASELCLWPCSTMKCPSPHTELLAQLTHFRSMQGRCRLQAEHGNHRDEPRPSSSQPHDGRALPVCGILALPTGGQPPDVHRAPAWLFIPTHLHMLRPCQLLAGGSYARVFAHRVLSSQRFHLPRCALTLHSPACDIKRG